jgi:hypothetical protein
VLGSQFASRSDNMGSRLPDHSDILESAPSPFF